MGKEAKSAFEEFLLGAWNKAEEQGICKYKLKINCKLIGGNKGFVIQCNTQREENRRPPQKFTSVSMPVDKKKFNFTKVDCREILFQMLKESHGKLSILDTNVNCKQHDGWKDVALINVSPFAIGHVLLVPGLSYCRPQILTVDAVELALNVQHASDSLNFITVFNSMCARASVNHLHFHSYYLSIDESCKEGYSNLLIQQDLPVSKRLPGQCFLCDALPVPAFLFQVLSQSEISTVAEDVVAIAQYFVKHNIAHNVSIVRGPALKLNCAVNQESDSRVVKLFLWPRTTDASCKSRIRSGIGACELSGHVFVPESVFNNTNEEELVDFLSSVALSRDKFDMIVNDVSLLLNSNKPNTIMN